MIILHEFNCVAANDNYYWPPINFEEILNSINWSGPSWDDPETWHMYDHNPYYPVDTGPELWVPKTPYPAI